ncbi:intermembrane lipid transfer protein VPS13B-like, partial [Atheta coriaria]|uniref:intermembrane lipid transfer protein VPS13B-like n=1 Tax=Dalotia coriaria TaxID=877792 RepID=UPI0031F3FD27
MAEFVYSRYMTEIMLSIQPIDLLVSPVTLKNYFLVLEPLLQVPALSSQPRKVSSSSSLILSNRSLPLTYIEFNGFRLIMPSVDMGKAGTVHNTCVFQVNRINLSPSAVNPICRTPCRPDIYQQAAQARILNVPGSEMEDRQYQLDINGICMNSGSWTEISQLLKNRGKSMSVLKTMSENPALEWNNLEKGKLKSGPEITYWSLISKFDISVIYAPAMIYKHDIICGHSIEVNFISDINFTVSLEQIKLIMSLSDEALGVLDVLLAQNDANKPSKVIFPYSIYQPEDECDLEVELDVTKDSGIETQASDLRSSFSLKTNSGVLGALRKMSELSEKSILSPGAPAIVKSSSTLSNTSTFIPLDVLITGGKVSLVLYEFETSTRSDMSRFFKENESDKGYEASEEESVIDVKMHARRFFPLLYFSLSQPNCFMSDTLLCRKIQISCYDVCIKVDGHGGHKILKSIPSEDDFGTHLLETKSGEPHLDTGVLPAFLTLKWSKGIGKPATLDVDIAKPTKIVCSLSRWLYLLQIQDKFLSNIIVPRGRFSSTDSQADSKPDMEVLHVRAPKTTIKGEHYLKYELIKQKFKGLSIINLKLSQMVLAMHTKNDVEVSVAFSSLTNNLSIQNRPEKLLNTTSIECMTIGCVSNGTSKLILNPWSTSFEVTLFWESWQSMNSSPQTQISAESDAIVLDISPDQVLNIQDLLEDIQELSRNFPKNSEDTSKMRKEPSKGPVTEKEQHYKDDLRAGAFHFVDSTSNNIDELPLPYQVVFWNRNVSAMAWRYPQPRALTKVRVFPVPFKISTGNEEDEQILCHLEYWSDCHGCYQTFTQFYLSETEMCHLELPKSYPQPAVACTWRVVLTAPMIKDYHQSRVFVSPRALAGCIRIDSYFNKHLIPQLTLAVHIASVNVNLINYFDKRANYTMPKGLKKFYSDLLIPDYQHVVTLTIDNANAYLATWKFEMAVFDINCNAKCAILDYAFLTLQQLIEPFSFKFEVSLAKTIGINIISQPIRVLFGAGAAHTL